MTEKLDNETERIYNEHYYMGELIQTLNLHTQKHGSISRTMFIVICQTVLKDSGIEIEGINKF